MLRNRNRLGSELIEISDLISNTETSQYALCYVLSVLAGFGLNKSVSTRVS
jgi:hypothetical protein